MGTKAAHGCGRFVARYDDPRTRSRRSAWGRTMTPSASILRPTTPSGGVFSRKRTASNGNSLAGIGASALSHAHLPAHTVVGARQRLAELLAEADRIRRTFQVS